MIAFAAALLMQAQMQAPPANPAPARAHAAPSFETLSRQAAEARDTKRLAEALILYRKALKLKPDWADGLWEAGSIEYDQDQYKECSDRKSTRLNSSHLGISYAVFCLKK